MGRRPAGKDQVGVEVTVAGNIQSPTAFQGLSVLRKRATSAMTFGLTSLLECLILDTRVLIRHFFSLYAIQLL